MNTMFLLLAGCVATSQISISSTTLGDQQVTQAEQVLKHMSDAHECLLRGVCCIEGTTTQTKTVGDKKSVSKELVDIFCAFDFDVGLIRFDRNVPAKNGVTRGGKFIRTPAHTYEGWIVSQDTNHVRDIVRGRPDKHPGGQVGLFDIRSLGHYAIEISSPDLTLEATYETFSKNGKLVHFSQESCNIYRLAWEFGVGQGTSREDFWVDAKCGYQWIRRRMVPVNPKSIQYECVVEKSYEDINGAWVPTRFQMMDIPWPGECVDAKWILRWKSVNEDPEDKYFRPEDLAGGERASLYTDECGDELIFLRTLGGESD